MNNASFSYKQLVSVLDMIYRGRPFQFASLFIDMYAKDKNSLEEEEFTNLLMDCAYISELNRYLYTKESVDKFEVEIEPYQKRIESIKQHLSTIYENYPLSRDNLSSYLNAYLPSFGKAYEYLLWQKFFKKSDENHDNLDFWPPYLLSSEISTISDIDSIVWLLACSIELDESVWKVIYAVTLHGQSLSRLCSEVLDYGGPTILIIEDTEGGVFGCFTREVWKSKTDFREDKSAFLFALAPHFGVYRSTGSDSNNLFLNSTSNPHLPHPIGIGFGGKLKSYRLWIHEELSSGESRSSCNTYARGKISSSTLFKIKTLEIWGCGGLKAEDLQLRARVAEEKEIEKRRKVKKDFVLETWDSGPARYIMDLAGKTGVSEPFLEDFRKIKAMKEKQRADEAEKLRQRKEANY